MCKKKDGENPMSLRVIQIIAFLFIILTAGLLVAEITGGVSCVTHKIQIATVLATLTGSILVFSTLEMQRKALNAERSKNEVERFDSRFYPILSSFRTDASNMKIEGEFISPKGIGVKSSYVGDNAFIAVRSMTNSLKRCLNDSSFKEFDKEEFDTVIDNYYKIFEALDDEVSFNDDEIDRVSKEKKEFIKSTQGAYLIYKMGISKEERENYRQILDEDKESFILEKLIEYQSSTLRKYIKSLRFILQIAGKVKDDGERKDYYSHISCLLGKEEIKFLNCFHEFDILTR